MAPVVASRRVVARTREIQLERLCAPDGLFVSWRFDPGARQLGTGGDGCGDFHCVNKDMREATVETDAALEGFLRSRMEQLDLVSASFEAS